MSKPLVVPADAERVTIDYLAVTLAGRGEDATVGVTVPQKWGKTTKPHVQVALDGTPVVQYPCLVRATVRVTVWHASTTTAKRLANLCMGLLLAHPGDADMAGCLPGTGVLPAVDPATKAQLASITVRAKLRMTVLV